jgi:hypothetical protein
MQSQWPQIQPLSVAEPNSPQKRQSKTTWLLHSSPRCIGMKPPKSCNRHLGEADEIEPKSSWLLHSLRQQVAKFRIFGPFPKKRKVLKHYTVDPGRRVLRFFIRMVSEFKIKVYFEKYGVLQN